MKKLGKLFEPIEIGKIRLENRITMPAMATNFADKKHQVTNQQVDYYKERAMGGAGLIIVEGTRVYGRPPGRNLGIFNDSHIYGLRELAKSIRTHGAKAAIQLAQSGRQTTKQPIGPSAIPTRWVGGDFGVPRELSIGEIKEIEEAFAEAARRAKSAGFEAIEIHGAHGYLISSFLSPYSNMRTDKYGGSFERRLRFAVEIVNNIRGEVGDDFPIVFRLNGKDYVKGGLALKDSKRIAQVLEKTSVNAIHVSAGIYESIDRTILPMYYPRSFLVPLAQQIKKVVGIPVITVGRINDPMVADRIIRENKADLVAMGRALIADPELPKKAREGRLGDICKCIACNYCFKEMFCGRELKCAVNAAVGKEEEYRIGKTDLPKRVLVIGGGPAGMEAARVARLRGNEVVLCERKKELGGQLLLASALPFKQELAGLTTYLSNQIRKAGTKILTNKEANAQFIKRTSPDAVVIATGATARIPDIPGNRKKIVATFIDVIEGKAEIGENVVVIGGGLIGCEIAVFLAEKGKNVTIVARHNIADDTDYATKSAILRKLYHNNVRVLTYLRIQRITDDGLIAADKNRLRQNVAADTIISAVGLRPNEKLKEDLMHETLVSYSVGDCSQLGGIKGAIHEASFAARKI
jgi:2,4-dienoyl-CoA reductase-like NADH-dependent reductase (Old Yellow Enzyme family)/thioredoxin reductase